MKTLTPGCLILFGAASLAAFAAQSAKDSGREIIDRIPFETARIRLERALFARLASGHMNGDPTA